MNIPSTLKCYKNFIEMLSAEYLLQNKIYQYEL